MTIAAVLFALAAVLGITLATLVTKGRERPLGIVLTHGALAAAGIIALLIAVVGDGATLAVWALVVFVLAALGGFVLFWMDRTNRPLPMPMVGGHGLVAVVAFVVLLVALFGGG